MAGSPSGLKLRERQRARQIYREGALLVVRHAPAIHYTQGSERWEGIDRRLRVVRGQYPTEADCSAMQSFLLWNALHARFGLPDLVNGEDWEAGYTGTMLEHGRHVSLHHRRFKVGDQIIYGRRGTTGAHGAGIIDPHRRVPLVVSHGSEGGPYVLEWNYRDDAFACRRYI